MIDPLYPDEPRKADQLTGRTQNRRTGKAEDWVGSFWAAHDDRPAHLGITRRPHVEEMNPEIPQWVRDKIVNELIWELDLTVDETDPFDPTMKGLFYPGEVNWSEQTKIATVTGRGKPVEISERRQKGSRSG